MDQKQTLIVGSRLKAEVGVEAVADQKWIGVEAAQKPMLIEGSTPKAEVGSGVEAVADRIQSGLEQKQKQTLIVIVPCIVGGGPFVILIIVGPLVIVIGP